MKFKASVFVYMVILLLAATEEHYCKGFINDVPTKTKDGEEIVDKAGDEFKYKYDTNTTYRTGTSSPGLLVQGQVDMIQKTHRGHVTDKQEKPIQANQNVVKRSILSIMNRSKRRCALVREFGRRKRGGVDRFQSGCSGSGIDVGGSGNVITTTPVSTSTSKPTTSNALSTTEKFKSKVSSAPTRVTLKPIILLSLSQEVSFTPTTESSTPTAVSAIISSTPSTESVTPTTASHTLTTLSSTPTTMSYILTTMSTKPSTESSIPTAMSSTLTIMSYTTSTVSSTQTIESSSSITTASSLMKVSSTLTTIPTTPSTELSTPTTVSSTLTTMSSKPSAELSTSMTELSSSTTTSPTSSTPSTVSSTFSTISFRPSTESSTKTTETFLSTTASSAPSTVPATLTTISSKPSTESSTPTTVSSTPSTESSTPMAESSTSTTLLSTLSTRSSIPTTVIYTSDTSTTASFTTSTVSYLLTTMTFISPIYSSPPTSISSTQTTVPASKYLTSTITSSSPSKPGTSSTFSTTNNKIPFTPNDSNQTEASANGLATREHTNQMIGLSAFSSDGLTFLRTKSSTMVSPSVTSRTTRSNRVSLSQTFTPKSIQNQNLKHMPTYVSNTQTVSLKNSIDVGSFRSETVTLTSATTLSTSGDMAFTGTLVSVEIETQETAATLNTSQSDNAKSGFFETVSNVAIVSIVAATTVFLFAVLLIYSYISQTGGGRQLWNSVSHGDESQWNGYDRESSTRQDRASPSSTTHLISGSSPPLTHVEVYDVPGLDF